MQEELDQIEADHEEKVQQMQNEIESLRASRTDLQVECNRWSIIKKINAKYKIEIIKKVRGNIDELIVLCINVISRFFSSLVC